MERNKANRKTITSETVKYIKFVSTIRFIFLKSTEIALDFTLAFSGRQVDPGHQIAYSLCSVPYARAHRAFSTSTFCCVRRYQGTVQYLRCKMQNVQKFAHVTTETCSSTVCNIWDVCRRPHILALIANFSSIISLAFVFCHRLFSPFFSI